MACEIDYSVFFLSSGDVYNRSNVTVNTNIDSVTLWLKIMSVKDNAKSWDKNTKTTRR